MDRREAWRNRETRKRRGDDQIPGGDPSWRRPAGPEQAAFQTISPRPGRAAPLPASGPELDAVVKWFDPGKGFGFVELSDGSGDAFLHVSVV
ncbi:MAG TPA: cold shock domain-containing protein, partial [Acetobacteraceae bacterium]|nr:cold shock domain-containing protein [Acetobacteraceae bacterium]